MRLLTALGLLLIAVFLSASFVACRRGRLASQPIPDAYGPDKAISRLPCRVVPEGEPMQLQLAYGDDRPIDLLKAEAIHPIVVNTPEGPRTAWLFITMADEEPPVTTLEQPVPGPRTDPSD